MVLPLFMLADVIAKWLMLLPLCFIVHVGRCYCLVADGIPTMGVDGRCYGQGADGIATGSMF